ncbi:MAG: hypothetical protein WCB34_12170 [Methylovirgula sp.]
MLYFTNPLAELKEETAAERRESIFATGRLWSLAALIRFCVGIFGLTMSHLMRAITVLSFEDDVETRRELKTALEGVELHMRECKASTVVQAQAKRLLKVMDTLPGQVLIGQCQALYNNVFTEFGEHQYLQIDATNKQYFKKDAKVFGDNVDKAFPDCADDIRAAARCLALGEGTASVFHSMRVLEYGLKALADEVGIKNFVLENWKNIIDQIESKIRDLEKQPKSSQKTEALRHFSAAAVQFRYFKDAWRNHTAHARSWYDEHVAKSIFEHVREFMQELAKRIEQSST